MNNLELWFKRKNVIARKDEGSWTELQSFTPESEVSECPECLCQKRYGHREHVEDCPAKDEVK